MSDRLPFTLWDDLLGLPFAEGARGPQAFDCVGVLFEMQRRLGRSIPDCASNAELLADARRLWTRVTAPQPGDAVLLYSSEPAWHLGIVTDISPKPWFLHAYPKTGVIRSRLDRFPWKNQIEGYYRWTQS